MTTKTAETKDQKDIASGYAGLTSAALQTKGETFKETEIDFTTSARSRTFSVADADVVVGNRITAWHSGNAATGRAADENELDALLVRAVCLVNGTITFYVDSLFGPVFGKFKLNYTL